jgi:hypothetical protein
MLLRIAALTLLLTTAPAAWAAEATGVLSMRCPDTQVDVFSATDGALADTCTSVARTFEFLARYGLDTGVPVEVHLVDALPPICQWASFACYDRRRRQVHALVPAKCMMLALAPGLPMTRALCRGILAHELAHAIAGEALGFERPRLLAHEYIAYVAMLSTLPPDERERVLSAFDGPGFDGPEEMSVDFYLMAPMRFGAEAYRHFLKPGNGQAFIDDLLDARALRR